MDYLLLVVGFVLLIKGADLFVEGSSSIAKMLKIPSMIVGLTIVAMGTSAPEAAVSISATLSKGANDIAVGNIVGSCILNIVLIVGVCAVIKPLNVEKSLLKSDFPVTILASVILLAVCIGKSGIISRFEGLILFGLFVAYLVFTVVRALKFRKNSGDSTEEIKVLSIPKTIVFTVLGAAAIVYGGTLTVDSAKSIAEGIGVSNHLIGLTVVALGTSLPELVTSIVASKKGESDMALGNVIGSNIFNILFILGMTAVIHPVKVNMASVYDSMILVGLGIMVFIFAFAKKKISRIEGGIMLASYAAYTAYIIMR
ncbi:MAG: calcium/sodium antiporter [Porcipelethomonas sp.]